MRGRGKNTLSARRGVSRGIPAGQAVFSGDQLLYKLKITDREGNFLDWWQLDLPLISRAMTDDDTKDILANPQLILEKPSRALLLLLSPKRKELNTSAGFAFGKQLAKKIDVKLLALFLRKGNAEQFDKKVIAGMRNGVYETFKQQEKDTDWYHASLALLTSAQKRNLLSQSITDPDLISTFSMSLEGVLLIEHLKKHAVTDETWQIVLARHISHDIPPSPASLRNLRVLLEQRPGALKPSEIETISYYITSCWQVKSQSYLRAENKKKREEVDSELIKIIEVFGQKIPAGNMHNTDNIESPKLKWFENSKLSSAGDKRSLRKRLRKAIQAWPNLPKDTYDSHDRARDMPVV